MAGYSGTPLFQKLGIKPATAVEIINEPPNYRKLLGKYPAGVKFRSNSSAGTRFIHFFATKRNQLEKALPDLRQKMDDDGVVWISWPKKTSGVTSDLTEDAVRAVALPLGLVDIKVCAVDATWSGLKLMIRRTDRKVPSPQSSPSGRGGRRSRQ